MLTLYKIIFENSAEGHDFQAVLVSAKQPTTAMDAGRAFVETEYPGQVGAVQDIDVICSTPDDVLDWA